ncbi:MAG: beta-ketoacyl-[acyl-carrier-protein] synthase family protein [Planctomycetales bacterium]|nr:beta-ketoacyl-[acyl-carrier-protein] synthase family protein [Planctomycetales bacterium]
MSSASNRRVVVTGMGLISPLGNTPAELFEALLAGRSGVAAFSSLSPKNLPTKIAAEATDFDGKIDGFGELPPDVKKAIRKGLKVMCRETQMGVAAAQRAIADAGFAGSELSPERIGCVFGSDYMLTEPDEFSDGIKACWDEQGVFQSGPWGDEGLRKMTPLWLLKYLPNMPGSHIAIFNDLRGPSNSLTHREAASNLAIGEAFFTIQRDSADLMVAGATGTRVHPMKAIHASQSEQLAPGDGDPAQASRPFDKNRTGMVLGEGAGTVVLEELASAQARGAKIYGEVLAAASSTVADPNLIAHRDQALANAMRQVFRSAGIDPGDVGHIHAHGLSTTTSDREEAQAIGEVFGAAAKSVPVVAAKANFGNLGAGSGAVEFIASCMALAEGKLFPLLNYESADDQCPIAPALSTSGPGDTFLNLSVTPQGQAAAVLVRRYAE